LKNKIVVGVAGMPGAGKATVVQVAEMLGYAIVVMGNVVREEARKRNLELTPENVGRVMLDLRKSAGPAVIARRCIPRIKESSRKPVIVDGLRSLYETDVLRKSFPAFKLLAIHSSPETRFNRLYNRRRSDDPASWETFLERDWRELRVGIGSVIASADSMIVNEGKKGALKREVKKFLENVTKRG
jgi:dephospho-CoA kinase